MRETLFTFEKPLADMQERIDALCNSAEAGTVNIQREINSLKHKLAKMKLSVYANMSPWDRVQVARHPDRPYTLDYIDRIFTDFLEFHGDRRYADDAAIVGGFAKFGNRNVMVIGTQKGRETRENVRRNFGCPHPEGYRKALRLMQLADQARVPIITFVDTPGAFPGVAAEERHIGEAIAVALRDSFALKVPFISIVIGEGGSGGALGLACGNRVLIMENAYYSVITPEGCAAILWKDRAYAEKAANMLHLTATQLKKLNIIDDIIPEPIGGAHRDYSAAAENVKQAIQTHLESLDKIDPEQLPAHRYARFRKLGCFAQ